MTAASHTDEAAKRCLKSKRADLMHSWRFDGDDPYVICVYCGERRNTMTGRVIPDTQTPGDPPSGGLPAPLPPPTGDDSHQDNTEAAVQAVTQAWGFEVSNPVTAYQLARAAVAAARPHIAAQIADAIEAQRGEMGKVPATVNDADDYFDGLAEAARLARLNGGCDV